MSNDRPKILIVDDVPANIQVLAQILKSENDVYFATNGEDALRIAMTKSPDLILLDVLMPDMDGYEVCKRLKDEEQTHDIPIIFVTAKGETEDETNGFRVGAVDYIVKPVSTPIVKARVHTHVELKRQREKLKNLSLIDGLTGIANRRRFDEELGREWRRCRREKAAMALIMLDIDHFKVYNDTEGHLAGDESLRRVATILADRVRRPSDLIARYGGEEFVCILPNTDNNGAVKLAETLREGVYGLNIPHKASPLCDRVTISLGIGVVVPSREMSRESFVKFCDDQLYKAKKNGRNRVECETLAQQVS